VKKVRWPVIFTTFASINCQIVTQIVAKRYEGNQSGSCNVIIL